MELDLEKSLSIIDQTLSQCKGTRQEHELLLKALQIVKSNLAENKRDLIAPSQTVEA